MIRSIEFEIPEDLDIDTWVPPLPSPLPVRVDASEEVWDKLLDYLWDEEEGTKDE